MFRRGSVILSAAATLAFAAGSPPQAAKADEISILGSAANYGVLGLTGTEIVTDSNVTINGNEGISQGATLSIMAPSTVTGNVYEYASGQTTGAGHVGGSIIVAPSTLTQNNTDVSSAVTTMGGLTATQTFSGISTATTITGSGGTNVIQINGDINLNDANLTLSGGPADIYVIRVTGKLALTGTASLNLSGGVKLTNVIYDFTGSTSDSINTHVNDVLNGYIVAPNLAMTLDGIFNGEIIGGQNISLLSGATVNAVSAVPLPATLPLFATGLGALSLLGWRRKRKNAAPMAAV
jgi:hypothetical protein